MEQKRLRNFERDERPWGHFERFTHNEPSTVKLISVRAGECFSLQTHVHRDEFWQVIGGSGSVTIGSQTREANIGDNFWVERGQPHRAEGGPEGLILLEIAFGEFDEKDIDRLEDKYGRA